ncbi:hypothetical protein GF345_05570 [Candidatus Woesearchaeota archaeon]|nr:hypothetical protein [Candidatus Woesearchaeota archaeon]
MKEDKLSKAMSIIRAKGPVIPSQINKELEIDVLMGSAVLSELVDKGQLKLTNVKIGGSPLYYAPGQETRLQEFSKHLNSKDQETFQMLKERKVVKDKDLEPLRRVSLRQIKDFAKPLSVKIGDEQILFWKWYLLSNEEAGKIIRGMLPAAQPKPREVKPEPAQVNREENKTVRDKQEQEATDKKPEQEKKENKEEKLSEEDKNEIKRKETQSRLGSDDPEKEEDSAIEIPDDKFFKKVKDYFDKNSIKIIDYKINRKESDIDFTVKILSSVGSLTYFCKAKNKKKFNDGDISSVFIEGQRKKLPVLLLMTGDLTKKAQDVLESEFKNMYVKKI